MALTFKSFQDVISDLQSSLTTLGSRLTDFRSGSRVMTLLSSVAISISYAWSQLQTVSSVFYVSSAIGGDLDARVGDFGLSREAGIQAAGSVLVFPGANNAGLNSTIPSGTILQTLDGKQTFTVTSNATVLSPFGRAPVVAVSVGSAGNLPAGTLLIDSKSQFNALAFVVGSSVVSGVPQGNLANGTDAESDSLLRSRFVDYLRNLARCTYPAVLGALKDTEGVASVVLQNVYPVPGYLTINAADSDGTLSDILRVSIQDTMTNWAAAGVAYQMFPISTLNVEIKCTATTTDNSVAPATIQSSVIAAIMTLNSKGLGQTLYLSEVIRNGFVAGLLDFTVEALGPIPASTATDVVPSGGQLVQINAANITVTVVYA